MNNERSVKALLWIVSVIWGLNVVMVKYLVGFFPPLVLAAIRIAAATLLLVLIMVWNKQLFTGAKQISGKAWMYIAGAGINGIFLHQMALSSGLQTANASSSSLILGLNPLVTGILAYYIFRESLTWNRIVGAVIGFTGVFIVELGDSLLLGSGGITFGKGEWLIGIAMLTYVFSGLFIKKAAETVPVLVITTYMHIIATILLSITGISEVVTRGGISWPTNGFVWAVLLFSGWVATALCTVWWNNGIKKIGAGRTAMFLNGMPVSSMVFAVILLGERLTWIQLIGFITVFLGIWLGTMNKYVSLKRQSNICDSRLGTEKT